MSSSRVPSLSIFPPRAKPLHSQPPALTFSYYPQSASIPFLHSAYPQDHLTQKATYHHATSPPSLQPRFCASRGLLPSLAPAPESATSPAPPPPGGWASQQPAALSA